MALIWRETNFTSEIQKVSQVIKKKLNVKNKAPEL